MDIQNNDEKPEKELPSNIIIKSMEEVMHDSMIPYSEHVIMDRALPRVEDGLKPVQRRIIYSMHELGVTSDKPYRKSARIVGDCLGKYHPHGDKSIYDAMVRMAQSFNMRHNLIDGHGNYGSVDGDGAAAMRYTEARMAPLAEELIKDIEKETVKWNLNFDDTTKEPDTLPGKFPNLLVNGSYGIAVGLATNIPPHNLAEVIDGVTAYIETPSITLPAMMKIIKGPDFPTGGSILGGEELIKAYETGRGKIIMYPKIHIEIGENDKRNIVITELPFQINKAELLQAIMELKDVKKDALSGIYDIVDESDREGMRAVIKVKKESDPKAICEVLFKSTSLVQTFGINMVAIADGKPQQMGLLDIISYYVDYQRTIIVRRTKYELNEAKEREHILEGLVIAVKNIDEVIKLIKESSSTSEAKVRLRERFVLSERQAQAILDLRLARLTKLEINKLEKELAEVRDLIKRLEAILASKKEQMNLIKAELAQIKRNFKEPRRSNIFNDKKQFVIPSEDDEKPIENYMIAYTSVDELKRIPQKNYSMATREFTDKSTLNDICPILIPAQSNHILYCFTNIGNCYKLDVDSLPEAKWRDKGAKLNQITSDAGENEKIIKIFNIDKKLPEGNLLFFTKQGLIKKSEWSEYNIIKSAFQAIKLKDDDELISIEQERKDCTIMIVTNQGMCLNSLTDDIPLQGRIAGGVKGISLADKDFVIAIQQTGKEGEIILITDKAFAKRVPIKQIDPMARYRKGIKIIELKSDNGNNLIYARCSQKHRDLILHDNEDFLYLFNTQDFSPENRTTKGKALCKLTKHIYIKDVYEYNT